MSVSVTSGGKGAGQGRGASAPGGTVQGVTFGGAKIWNSEIWPLLANWRLHFLAVATDQPKFYCTTTCFLLHPNLTCCSQSTLMPLATIRISIGDLIAGVGVAKKTFAPGGKHPHAATGRYAAVTYPVTLGLNLPRSRATMDFFSLFAAQFRGTHCHRQCMYYH